MTDKEIIQKITDKKLTDEEIVQKLIERDNLITRIYFFEYCKPKFHSIIHEMFNYQVDYDEIVNELYIHLMEDDARRLRTFHYSCSLSGWLQIVVRYYFMDKKKHDKVIENAGDAPLVEKEVESVSPHAMIEAKIDIEQLIKRLERTHPRYAYVLRKLFLEDVPSEDLAKEMNITVANLYNIKKRALQQLALLIIIDKKELKKQEK